MKVIQESCKQALSHATFDIQATKRCETECKKFGYEVFGIEKFAECYSGDGGLATYNMDGPTRQCFTSNYKRPTLGPKIAQSRPKSPKVAYSRPKSL
ncbi:hypothetical protein ACROYT_G043948 [Oculina patagonica]